MARELGRQRPFSERLALAVFGRERHWLRARQLRAPSPRPSKVNPTDGKSLKTLIMMCWSVVRAQLSSVCVQTFWIGDVVAHSGMPTSLTNIGDSYCSYLHSTMIWCRDPVISTSRKRPVARVLRPLSIIEPSGQVEVLIQPQVDSIFSVTLAAWRAMRMRQRGTPAASFSRTRTPAFFCTQYT